MSEQALRVRVETLHEPDKRKPRLVVVAAAIGRSPQLSDIDTMLPPRGAMMPYPPAPSVAAESAARARKALALGGTVLLCAVPHAAAGAQKWIKEIQVEAAP
jgi:hypothetical protein